MWNSLVRQNDSLSKYGSDDILNRNDKEQTRRETEASRREIIIGEESKVNREKIAKSVVKRH